MMPFNPMMMPSMPTPNGQMPHAGNFPVPNMNMMAGPPSMGPPPAGMLNQAMMMNPAMLQQAMMQNQAMMNAMMENMKKMGTFNSGSPVAPPSNAGAGPAMTEAAAAGAIAAHATGPPTNGGAVGVGALTMQGARLPHMGAAATAMPPLDVRAGVASHGMMPANRSAVQPAADHLSPVIHTDGLALGATVTEPATAAVNGASEDPFGGLGGSSEQDGAHHKLVWPPARARTHARTHAIQSPVGHSHTTSFGGTVAPICVSTV